MTPRDFLQILRKRKWLILVCLLFFTGVATVTTILWAKYAPMYTAAAYLEIKPSQMTRGYEMPQFEVTAIGLENRLRTHAELIVAVPVLVKAVADEDVKATPWYKQESHNASLRLKDILDVSPVRETSLILIKVTARDANTAATLATAVGQAYQRDNEETTNRQFDKHLRDLTSKKDDLEIAINEYSAAIRTMAGGTATQEQHNKVGVEVTQLTMQELELTKLFRSATASRNNLILLQETGSLGEAPEVLARLSADPSYLQLLGESAQATNNYRFLITKYGDTHPSVIDAAQQLQMIQQELAVRENLATEGIVVESERLIAALVENRDMVRDQRQGALDRSARIGATLAELHAMQVRLERATIELAEVDRGIVQTRIIRTRTRPVSLRQAAQPPDRRSQPKWSIMMPSGILLGLFIGLGLSLLLEAVDTSIKRPSDITRRVDLPLLGMIPFAGDLAEDIDNLYLALQTHPDSPFGEAFRQIRTRLIFSGPISEQRSLLITSPSPEDGRTVVAINLGITMAQAGSKVLLVDANFRQPMFCQIFPDCPVDGLTNALVDQSNWRDLVHEVQPNLSVMSSGPLPTNPAELLGSNHMRQLIEEMSEQYDRVIFDSGPCLVVTDPAILAVLVEGVILNIRAGVNSQGVAQRARNTISEAGGHVLGVTLNGVRAMAGGYLRKHYETFYEYRERQALPPAAAPKS